MKIKEIGEIANTWISPESRKILKHKNDADTNFSKSCSNNTDYFSTRRITTPWRTNTYTHSADFIIKYFLTKARMLYVVLKPTKPHKEY